jgi:hypothetical protein
MYFFTKEVISLEEFRERKFFEVHDTPRSNETNEIFLCDQLANVIRHIRVHATETKMRKTEENCHFRCDFLMICD